MIFFAHVAGLRSQVKNDGEPRFCGFSRFIKMVLIRFIGTVQRKLMRIGHPARLGGCCFPGHTAWTLVSYNTLVVVQTVDVGYFHRQLWIFGQPVGFVAAAVLNCTNGLFRDWDGGIKWSRPLTVLVGAAMSAFAGFAKRVNRRFSTSRFFPWRFGFGRRD